MPTVTAVWNIEVSGNPFTIFCSKVKAVKAALRSLNKSRGNLTTIFQQLRNDLAVVQHDLLTDKSQILIGQEADLIAKLNVAILHEEHFHLQKV